MTNLQLCGQRPGLPVVATGQQMRYPQQDRLTGFDEHPAQCRAEDATARRVRAVLGCCGTVAKRLLRKSDDL